MNFEFLSFLNNDNDPLWPNVCGSFDYRVLLVLQFSISRQMNGNSACKPNRTVSDGRNCYIVFFKNERNAVDSFDDVISTDYMLRSVFFLILAVQKPRKNNKTTLKELVKHNYTARLTGLP